MVTNFSWLVEGRVGGMACPWPEDVPWLRARGVTAVLSLTEARPELLGVEVLHVPVVDMTSPTLDQLHAAVAFIRDVVARGGVLNFSFAQLASSPVVFRDRRRIAWTPHLEMLPQRVRRSDFRHFDFALISAGEELHRQIAADPLTEPVTAAGRWRLYRVVPPPGAERRQRP